MIVKEIRFPDDVSYGSSGGPTYSTLVPQTGSGYEDTVSNWSAPRHRYDVGYGIRTFDMIEKVIAFFHVVRARAFGFRFKDWADFKSCAVSATTSATDQSLGTGDGVIATFQLWKTYTYSGESYARKITKPVAGTVKVAVNGVQKTITTHFTVSTVTGVVTFTSGNIPTIGQAVTAGYEFDVPVRFENDSLNVSLDNLKVGGADVSLIEVRV